MSVESVLSPSKAAGIPGTPGIEPSGITPDDLAAALEKARTAVASERDGMLQRHEELVRKSLEQNRKAHQIRRDRLRRERDVALRRDRFEQVARENRAEELFHMSRRERLDAEHALHTPPDQGTATPVGSPNTPRPEEDQALSLQRQELLRAASQERRAALESQRRRIPRQWTF